jgi:hypothetical protein
MLEHVKSDGNDTIVSWQLHGKAFRIHKPKEFAEIVLPRYSNNSKYRSFQRQLHLYDFQRITDKQSPDFGAYYHKLFQKDQIQLSLQMTRRKIKGSKDKAHLTDKDKKSEGDTHYCPKPSSSCISTASKEPPTSIFQDLLESTPMSLSSYPITFSKKEPTTTLEWINSVEKVISNSPNDDRNHAGARQAKSSGFRVYQEESEESGFCCSNLISSLIPSTPERAPWYYQAFQEDVLEPTPLSKMILQPISCSKALTVLHEWAEICSKAAASHDQHHHWAHEVPLVDDAFLFAANGLQE